MLYILIRKSFTFYILKKAIVLSRVSTSSQDLSQQTDEVLREVYKDGYTKRNIIIIEDTESAIQLSEEERHGLNKMKDHINRDPAIQCVYIYELSRLSRRQLVLFSIRDFLVERQIQLICLKPYFRLLEVDGTLSQTGSLMFSLFSSLSESEMMLKKERMMRGRRRNKELGKSIGGRPPFGYDIDKEKRYIIDKHKSSLVLRIYNDYGYGNKSMMEIAKELKEEGYFPHITINSTLQHIQKILNRNIYIGEFPYPRIISPELFAIVQYNIESSAENKIVRHRAPFLLKGIVCDARTGYILSINGAIDTYFSKHYSGAAIRRLNIDPLAWEHSKIMYERYVMNKDKLLKLIKAAYQNTAKKIAVIDDEIKDIAIKMERVEESYILGRISKKKSEQLRQRLLEERQIKKNRREELVDLFIRKQSQKKCLTIDSIDESLLTHEDKLSIIHRVIDTITVEKPNPTYSIIKIYNRINSLVYVYEVHCWRHTWTLIRESTSNKDPHIEIKCPKGIRRTITQ